MSKPPRRNLRTLLVPRLVGAAACLPPPLALGARPALAAALRSVPGWRARVTRGMEAALGLEAADPRRVRDYFRHLADLVAYSVVVSRCGIHQAPFRGELVLDSSSRRYYQEALEAGRGALMICPHLIGHEIMAGATTELLPVTVLVRQSPDPRYAAIKERWYGSLGVEVVHRPRKDGEMQGLAEMTAALRALRKNRVLALTPDLLQKPGTGVPVRLFGREAELPAGAFYLAARMGAPLLPSFFHQEEGRYRLWTHEPLLPNAGTDRDAAVADLAQRWAALFEEFVRAHPDMWQFWLDKRWSRWLGTGS